MRGLLLYYCSEEKAKDKKEHKIKGGVEQVEIAILYQRFKKGFHIVSDYERIILAQ